jgi:Bacterial surface proteins containing Ig-like domains
LDAEVSPANASNKTVRWFVTNGTGSANIDMLTGTLTGVTAGSVTIRAEAQDGSGRSATKTITVQTTNRPVTGITISGGSSVNAGQILQLTATVTPSNATNPTVFWSITASTATGTTINSATGLITAGSTGGDITVRAEAQDGSGIFATQGVNVVSVAPPGTIAITNGVYIPNYSGQYLTDGSVLYAASVKNYFTATGGTLYLYNTDASSSSMTWAQAASACTSVQKKRLPNLYELAQLQDAHTTYGLRSAEYWSSTWYSSNMFWIWNFNLNFGTLNGNTGNSYVRCVWSD